MRYKDHFYSTTYKCSFKQVSKTTAQKHYEAGVEIYILPSNSRTVKDSSTAMLKWLDYYRHTTNRFIGASTKWGIHLIT